MPVSRLAECVARTHDDLESMNLTAPVVGHVGDGNFHVMPLVDMTDPEKVRQALANYEFGESMDGMMQPGKIKFDKGGWNFHTFPTMIQWQNNTVRTVFPEEVATAKVIWPVK